MSGRSWLKTGGTVVKKMSRRGRGTWVRMKMISRETVKVGRHICRRSVTRENDASSDGIGIGEILFLPSGCCVNTFRLSSSKTFFGKHGSSCSPKNDIWTGRFFHRHRYYFNFARSFSHVYLQDYKKITYGYKNFFLLNCFIVIIIIIKRLLSIYLLIFYACWQS